MFPLDPVILHVTVLVVAYLIHVPWLNRLGPVICTCMVNRGAMDLDSVAAWAPESRAGTLKLVEPRGFQGCRLWGSKKLRV